MKLIRNAMLAVTAVFASFLAGAASAEVSTVAVSGYDVVSYHSGTPVRGSGNNVVSYNGVTYLFATEENKNAFSADPAKYAPAYGGYCAYGAAVGKKFFSDPEVWKIVDGTLYLNLSDDVSKVWHRDIPGNISKADANWKTIADVAPGDL
ncbi:YHS domain-containing (seleno)protein [Kordiimonas aquimaris]|uniref:YHS domain-containing (seleno)protein n=1 Tax=Kordiimonas aquimaris TaxID=707591 RepID=UPI0021D2A070|nr:YHS domain-containing (seleno)protein [Kordiimonas aquimaris]